METFTLDPAPLGAVAISGMRRMGGGASREIWSFDAVMPDGSARALVLRRDRPGQAFASVDEGALLRAAERAGVPVPHVVCDVEGGFVMERVEGETIPRRILREDRFTKARAQMAAQCGEIAARIHSIAPPEGLRRPSGDHVGRAELAALRDLFDSFDQPHPTFELAFRWLGERAPETRRVTLVHGDFRHGNFIVGSEGIRAVLDWELAHAGDPLEDLGWLCVKSWRFGQSSKPVGGFGVRDDLVRAYEQTTGARVDPDALRWWETFGTLRWGVICIIQAFTHLNGAVRSVELATIGRRVCETEWDLFELVDA